MTFYIGHDGTLSHRKMNCISIWHSNFRNKSLPNIEYRTVLSLCVFSKFWIYVLNVSNSFDSEYLDINQHDLTAKINQFSEPAILIIADNKCMKTNFLIIFNEKWKFLRVKRKYWSICTIWGTCKLKMTMFNIMNPNLKWKNIIYNKNKFFFCSKWLW